MLLQHTLVRRITCQVLHFVRILFHIHQRFTMITQIINRVFVIVRADHPPPALGYLCFPFGKGALDHVIGNDNVVTPSR